MRLELDEVRRLTGPNMLCDTSGAILDVFIEGVDTPSVIACWQKYIAKSQEQVNWEITTFNRVFEGGASMAINAPMDVLYGACDLAELAWDACVDELTQANDLNFNEKLAEIVSAINSEANPALIAILKAAKKHHVVCLADDDEVSLGTGITSRTWPIDALPNINEIDWHSFTSVPLALITGTNGKSTSVRLAAHIAKQEGLAAGVTSTDFIKVADSIIDEGDYSGPGGARMLLRDNRTEIAFLEVARGGLLRRGLPIEHAQVALVTNAASDHLGQYGINTVDEIAQVKLMVAKAIHEDSHLVLNADDKRLTKYVPNNVFDSSNHSPTSVPLCWFSPNIHNPLIQQSIQQNMPCVYVENNQFVYSHLERKALCDIESAPMTVNGTAKHNIQNALGVIGLCKLMDISDKAIVAGLESFGENAQDNPGRGNIYRTKGRTVIVDFAHNEHSMQAVMSMAKNMADNIKRMEGECNIHVMFSHAGDRSNTEILKVVDAVMSIQPTQYILSELEEYLRGRELGEISELVQDYLVKHGISNTAISLANNPLQASKIAMEHSKPKDLVLLFVLSHREEVQALLEQNK